MKKIIGSIVIMIILGQPITADSSYKIKTISINIIQEYKQYIFLTTEKKEQGEHTLEDLGDNMQLITKLLNTKNEIVASIQENMNEKSTKKDNMNEVQITKFREFMEIANINNEILHSAINIIDSKKDLKTIQQAILKNKIDYSIVKSEINSVYASQKLAIDSLTNIITSGDILLNIL